MTTCRSTASGFLGAAAEAAAQHADDHRHQGQENDGYHQQRQVFLDEWHVAEEVAQGHQAADPQDGTGHAEGEEARVGHPGNAGNKRGEGADDGQETRQGHGLATVFFIEIVGFLQIVAAEDLRVGIAEQAFPGRSSDYVVGTVAQDRCEHQQAPQQHRVHATAGGHGAGNEQQRIPGQKWHHHQAGLAEDHQEQNGVDPGPVVGHQHVEIHVEMKDEVDRVEIH